MSSVLVSSASPPPEENDSVISRLSTWVGASRRPLPPTHTRPSVETPGLANEALDQIGAENEEIKNRCIDLVRTIDEMQVVKENFVAISNWIGQILLAREETNAALVERAMMVALAEGALSDLKTEARSLYEQKEEVVSENSLLLAENERLKASVRNREARIEAVETELHESVDVVAQLREELEAERAQHFHVRNEHQSALSVIDNNDALISQLQADLAAASDQSVFARQHADMLEANLVESQQNAAKLQTANTESQIYAAGLADNIRELEIALESERRQVAKLDEIIASNQSEHLKAQNRWREEKDESQRLIAELEAQVDKLSAHAQAGDQLLVEVRGELQAKVDECRAEERRAQEIEQKFLRLGEHSESVSLEAQTLKQKLDERDRAYARLSRRAKGVIRAMRDLSTLRDKAEQKAQLSGERLSAETRRFDEHKERLERTIYDLTEQLEKERLSKMMTAGALEAARQQRLQPREETKLADILARAEEAHNAAEAEAGFDPGLPPPRR